MNRIVIYTAAFGDSFGVVPQKEISGIDFICFTDNVSKVPKPWKAILFENNELDNHLKNRYVKILPHHVLSQYDISIYIDSNFLIIGDVKLLIQNLGDFKMAAFDHNQTDDARNCIYDEFEAIKKITQDSGVIKDSIQVMEKQIEFFQKERFPKNIGLIKGGVLIRKHNDKEVVKIMADWWKMVSTMSRRDQLSFNYIAWKNNFKFTYIDGDLRFNNPYFYFLASSRKSYTKRLWKYKIKKFLGSIKHPKP